MLPLLRFGAGGIVVGSIAAAQQSNIDSAAAGSLFATLHSLGATGMGVLLFGSTGSALGLVSSLAVKLFASFNTVSKFVYFKRPITIRNRIQYNSFFSNARLINIVSFINYQVFFINNNYPPLNSQIFLPKKNLKFFLFFVLHWII